VALAGALAACASTTTATTTPPAPSSTTTGAGAAAPAGTAAVTIKDFTFTPMSLTVKVGTTVTWTNDDLTPHDVQFETGGIPTSPHLSAGGGQRSWSHTFTTAGTYAYVCGIHTYMTGTIKVTG
jgi:plastocyanin